MTRENARPAAGDMAGGAARGPHDAPDHAPDGAPGPVERALARAAELWALAGGALLCAVVLMNVWSVVASALAGAPFPGDFELTEMGVCVAAFAFLPHCQMSGANVTADIFTMGASRRWLAAFSLAGSLAALCFSALLLWRMWFGMTDQMTYGYTTAILQIPHWQAFALILPSLALLAAASAATLARDLRALLRS
ncbi:TRAP transporter small permease [Oceanicella actignis]|uniref:TRAP transporter small permease n=1 Tax=Oceanicella actignis TaxID=1189325 RepID=UPI0012510B6C|nr:TRAP transporter small permease [Oceanicella actignis]TYO91587.1 TRAP-type C4-dicarboxylate transport system permease small subunit [Oceanicella actignis]